MNGPLVAASVLCLLASVLHGLLAEITMFRTMVGTPLPDLRLPRPLQFLAPTSPAANTDLG